jgi:hypothetical protein
MSDAYDTHAVNQQYRLLNYRSYYQERKAWFADTVVVIDNRRFWLVEATSVGTPQVIGRGLARCVRRRPGEISAFAMASILAVENLERRQGKR